MFVQIMQEYEMVTIAYADDIALLCRSIEGLQTMLDVCADNAGIRNGYYSVR